MGTYKIKPNARKCYRVTNNEFELCKFPCVHLKKTTHLVSELTPAQYREPVPLTSLHNFMVYTLASTLISRKIKYTKLKLKVYYYCCCRFCC